MNDRMHWLSGSVSGAHPPTPDNKAVVLTSGPSVDWNLNNTQRLHLGFDPMLVCGVNGFTDFRLMQAGY